MADIKQNIPFDGIDRQEEEVRDLFNLLIKNESADLPRKAASTVAAPMQQPASAPTIQESVEVEESVVAEEPAEIEAEETIPEATAANPAPVSEEPIVVEESAQEPMAPQTTPNVAPPVREREAYFIDEDDEDDIGLELPPLVLTQYDEIEDEDEDDYGDYIPFILPSSNQTQDYEVDAAPAERRNPLLAFWRALCGNVPLPCDSKQEIVRKSAFWLSLVVIVGALTYILYNVWWLPSFTKNMYNDVAHDYHPDIVGVVSDGAYPEEMQLSFQSLYDRNNEIRGWLSFHASGNRDFLNIEYPIMYSGDNDKYLTVDFNGNKNKNGALFFDMRTKLNSSEDTNTSLIVYGHNMASGQMLAGLNKFIGNVNNARVAPTLTMNTLFADGQYKVFAVIITDESAQEQYYFNVRRTQFGGDEDYLDYIKNLRARSLFDYPVDVKAGDELLLLSTCTVPSSAKIGNGRLTVVARKVRSGESAAVNTSSIVKNDDVIMPYAWYTLQNKQPHAYYTGGTLVTPSGTTAATTVDNMIDQSGSLLDPQTTTSSSDAETRRTTTTNALRTSGGTKITTAAPVSGNVQTTSKPISVGSTTVAAPTTTIAAPTTTVAVPTTTIAAPTTTVAEATTTAAEATTTAAETTTTAAETTTTVAETTTTAAAQE